jgi:hypothetical protein
MGDSLHQIPIHTTPNTLFVMTNGKLSYGGKGDLLVDDGIDVIQKVVGADNEIVTFDTSAPADVSYKPFQLVSNNIIIPIQGGIRSENSSTRYAGFNIRIARSSPTLIDYYCVPHASIIDSIEMIIIPSGTVFSWPTFANSSQYYGVNVGYENAGTFTSFSPTVNPHFTISQGTLPIAGVTNFSRSGAFNIVRFKPSSASYTWNVAANQKIGVRLTSNFASGTKFILVVIYIKGNFTNL